MEGAAIGYQSPQFVPRDSIIMPTPPTHQPSSVTYPAVITEVFSTSPPTISCYLLRQVWHNYTWIYESQTSQECWVKVPSKSTMHIFRPSYPSTKDSCLIVKHMHYLYFHTFAEIFSFTFKQDRQSCHILSIHCGSLNKLLLPPRPCLLLLVRRGSWDLVQCNQDLIFQITCFSSSFWPLDVFSNYQLTFHEKMSWLDW